MCRFSLFLKVGADGEFLMLVLSIVLIDGTLRCDGEEDVVDHTGVYHDYGRGRHFA